VATANKGNVVADIREKVAALRARALHPGTPVEEARSCAVMALKLESKHGLDRDPALTDHALEIAMEVARALAKALHLRALKGGYLRAEKLSKEQRSASASKAAAARWQHLGGDEKEQRRRAKRAAAARARRGPTSP
jgi:hypothetical protein